MCGTIRRVFRLISCLNLGIKLCSHVSEKMRGDFLHENELIVMGTMIGSNTKFIAKITRPVPDDCSEFVSVPGFPICQKQFFGEGGNRQKSCSRKKYVRKTTMSCSSPPCQSRESEKGKPSRLFPCKKSAWTICKSRNWQIIY